MNSDYDGKKKIALLRSFSYAFSGVYYAFRQERNMKIHCLAAIVVIFLGFYLQLSAMEWGFILLAVGGMFSLEMVNTAIERTVDLITEEYHPLAKQAKDIAAGAVIVYAITSVIIGCIIFLPKIFKNVL
nr:diacylglycerol kinase family protein [uncultured Bacillus sp.]